MVEPTNGHVVQLRDGRRMGYAVYGHPDGFVIVSAHGGLACRLDVAAADAVARDAGVRLVSPDHPGIGWSDPQPGRTVLDWADDVTTCWTNSESTASAPWDGRWAASTPQRWATRCRRG